ncbi:MAG: pyruvate kinase [Arcobacteraceae bacterium]|nr:pyruvate kinase [Arcobacteraceae bacterium]
MQLNIIEDILNDLKKLREDIINFEVDESLKHYKSLSNLKAYLRLRAKDITQLQDKLTSHGLSSFGRSQSSIVNAINQDIILLSKLLDSSFDDLSLDSNFVKFHEAKTIMYKNGRVFGGKDDDEHTHLQQIFKTRVMITLPSEAKNSPQLIGELIKNGASILRINTAHDTPDDWNMMAKYIQNENSRQSKNTKIYVDLAGPKNRTGKIKRVFSPFKIGSWRNPTVVELATNLDNDIFTTKNNNGISTLVVSDELFKKAKVSKSIKIYDFEREKYIKYKLTKENDKIYAIANKKVTIFEKTIIKIKDIKSNLYNLELNPLDIRLHRGDEILISHHDILGDIDFEYEGKKYAALINCTNKEIFEHVKINDDIFIDDGKIGCTLSHTNSYGVGCKVFLAKENGTNLKEEKGINFPNSDLIIPAITPTDEKNLESIIDFADIIGISFAQSADDIKKLKDMLSIKEKFNIAIVPKIETKLAITNLPSILEELLGWEQFAIMIARGDLAIEVGFDNLPYIQEEIFGICEAAHIPVIYATQILEGKMKNNLPSRSEVTDAAFAQRADCVMLNKGDFVIQTVSTLKQILRSMHTIFQKNKQLLSCCEIFK